LQKTDSERVVALAMQTAELTNEIFKQNIRKFIEKEKTVKNEQISLSRLQKQTGNKLENVEINSENIGDFRSTASKYGLQYAIKKQPAENPRDPPTYFVFFMKDTAVVETMKKAFEEYSKKTENKEKTAYLDLKTVQKSIQTFDKKAVEASKTRAMNKFQAQNQPRPDQKQLEQIPPEQNIEPEM
jgi:hypothetical protein